MFLQSLLFILLTSTIFPQPSWYKLKTPTDQNLRKVFYLDSLHCWVAGDSGVIMFSSDKGKSWELQESYSDNYIEDIFFLNDTVGWALTWLTNGISIQSKILSTIDGGKNWNSRNHRNQNVILSTVYFLDSLTGFIGGAPFEFIMTTDGGSEWLPVEIDTGSFAYYPVYDIKFYDSQYGFAVGGLHDMAGAVWKTIDGGYSWSATGVAPEQLFDFEFLDSANVIMLTGEIECLYPIGMIRTSDAGINWSYDELEYCGNVNGMDFRTANELWAGMANQPQLLMTTDFGDTWQVFNTPDSLFTYDIDFADSLHGIAVSQNGYIFIYKPEPTSVDDNANEVLKNFCLFQNYPNPFNPSTKIKYQIPSSSKVILKVYDVLGNEIATLVDEFRNAGRYEVTFDATNLSSGIYFYRLQAGNFIETKKMLLLR